MRTRLWYRRAIIQRYIGLRSRKRVRFMKAHTTFSRALAFNPQFAAARYQRGLLNWRELHNYEQAIEDFTAILDRFEDALFFRAMAYESLGGYATAATDLAQFMETYPESHWYSSARRQFLNLQAILDDAPRQLTG